MKMTQTEFDFATEISLKGRLTRMYRKCFPPKVNLNMLQKQFPFITSASNRTRGEKTYLTITFDNDHGYNNLSNVVRWVQKTGFPNSHITSGGMSGGTIRTNDNWAGSIL